MEGYDVIGVISIITVFSACIAFIFIIAFYTYKTQQAKFKLLEKSVETGQPLPSQFFKSQNKNALSKGILLTMAGIGLFIALYFGSSFKPQSAFWGFIPFLLGIGYLIIYFIERKNKENQDSVNNEQCRRSHLYQPDIVFKRSKGF